MKRYLYLCLFLGLLFHTIKGFAVNGDNSSCLQDQMIWTQETDYVKGKQQYVVFRKEFNLNKQQQLQYKIEIFADSRYLLWINGTYVVRGPVRFNPKSPEYDIVPVDNYLKDGRNVIVALVHSYGEGINGRIMYHEPGLGVRLLEDEHLVLTTDTTWRYSTNTRYLLSDRAGNSMPDKIDARIDNEEWLGSNFDDSSWRTASKIAGERWGSIRKSEIPLCLEMPIKNVKILPLGKVVRYPVSLKKNEELVLDLGAMAMAYTDIELTADEGITLDIKYALRYKNGRPYEMFGKGNQYITRKGKQHFITTDQWCCRYVVLKVDSGEVLINKFSFVNRRYPFERIGSFECSDSFFNDLWKMGIHTIETVSDDAYGTDARERNEWIQDGHKASFSVSSVALSAPLYNGKTDVALLKSMLRHAALSQLEDGILLATFPTDRGRSDCHYIIEDYACQWIEGMYHYYSITKDIEFVKENKDVMVRLIHWFMERITSKGLVYAREYASFDNPMAYVTCEGATLNAFFYQALQCAVKLSSVLNDNELERKYSQVADLLKKKYNEVLWMNEEGAYSAAILENEMLQPSVHAQLFALYVGLVPEDRIEKVRSWLLENYRNPGTKTICVNNQYRDMLQKKSGIDMPIIYYWLLKVLYDIDTASMDSEILQNIREKWFNMVTLQKDTGTLSESFIKPDGTGSDESCHNYGAVPVYYLSSYVLGVRENKEGEILIEPRLGDLLFAKGKVVTPYGPVSVNWERRESSLAFDVVLPLLSKGELHVPLVKQDSSIEINGHKILDKGKIVGNFDVDIKGRWCIVRNVQGNISGKIE